MKKQSKKLMLVAIALLALVALPLVGCKNAAGESHTHSFDETKWKSDATGHWYECSCGEKQEGSFAAHSYGGWEGDANTNKVAVKCTVCGHQNREIPDFVYVKGGEIEGAALPWENATTDADEKGVFIAGRTVKLSDFFIGKYEVTQAEWKAVMGENNNPSNFKGDNLPVEHVSWYDAVVYCNKRSIKEGLTPCYKKGEETDPDNWGAVPTSSKNDSWKDAITCDLDAGGYRLPTEAEWEYAARGGKPSTEDGAPWNYQWAGTNYENNSPEEKNNLEDYAWYKDTPGVGEKTHEVGTKNPNSLGIHDMSGNVWEWCWDRHGTVGTGQETNPTGPASGSDRVYRGGSGFDYASGCSVSNRVYDYPFIRNFDLGFRVVRPSSK